MMDEPERSIFIKHTNDRVMFEMAYTYTPVIRLAFPWSKHINGAASKQYFHKLIDKYKERRPNRIGKRLGLIKPDEIYEMILYTLYIHKKMGIEMMTNREIKDSIMALYDKLPVELRKTYAYYMEFLMKEGATVKTRFKKKVGRGYQFYYTLTEDGLDICQDRKWDVPKCYRGIKYNKPTL